MAGDKLAAVMPCDAALADDPVARGFVLEHAERFAEAEALYRSAGSDRARTRLGFLMLAQGRYDRAWPLLESRDKPKHQGPMPPRWRGESLRGRTIAVTLEAGLGDQIQFARWLPRVKARGAAHVVAIAPSPLARLFSRMPGISVVGVPVEGQHAHVQVPLMPDCYIELCSLPRIFDARPHSIPLPPYLAADPTDIERWRPRLPEAPLRVGLVWRGSTANVYDPWRSIPGLATLAPLWRVPDVAFVSLQKGAGEEEARSGLLPLTHLGSDVRDFADTAAILSQLDLLISVDTSAAHLAGALGRPVWLLLERVPDWRWRHAEALKRWYPTARCFNQVIPGDWSAPIEEAAEALRALDSGHGWPLREAGNGDTRSV